MKTKKQIMEWLVPEKDEELTTTKMALGVAQVEALIDIRDVLVEVKDALIGISKNMGRRY